MGRWVDGQMNGRMDGLSKSRFKECLQQSKDERDILSIKGLATNQLINSKNILNF